MTSTHKNQNKISIFLEPTTPNDEIQEGKGNNFLKRKLKVSDVSTGSDKTGNDVPEQANPFNLRKRRNVNYNPTAKKFSYDSNDSDYKESPKRKHKGKKTTVKETKQRTRVDPKMYTSPTECRRFQLDGLLSWKNVKSEESRDDESVIVTLANVNGINLDQFASEDLQAIVVNPPWADDFGIEDFNQINLPLNRLKEGLIFVWAHKHHISDIVYHFENQGIKYVENVVWIMLNPENKQTASHTSDPFNLNNKFTTLDYEYFTNSHLTLLMFRKFLPSNKRYLELRHQRTGDAVFDHCNSSILNYRPFDYTYQLIETLLPKATYVKGEKLKMLEIYSQEGVRRKGWIHITEKK